MMTSSWTKNACALTQTTSAPWKSGTLLHARRVMRAPWPISSKGISTSNGPRWPRGSNAAPLHLPPRRPCGRGILRAYNGFYAMHSVYVYPCSPRACSFSPAWRRIPGTRVSPKSRGTARAVCACTHMDTAHLHAYPFLYGPHASVSTCPAIMPCPCGARYSRCSRCTSRTARDTFPPTHPSASCPMQPAQARPTRLAIR